MAAITKRLLHLRPSLHSYARPYPYPHFHFSSSSDRDDAPQSEQSQTHSSVSPSLNDVRARLQNGPPPPPDRRQPPRSPFSFPSGAPPQTPPPSRAGSTDEIRNRLAEFRSRSAPPPPSPFAEKYVSLHELYEKNIKSKGEGSDAPPGLGAGRGNRSFDSIRESLSKLESTGAANSGRKPGDSFSLSHFTKSLKMNTDPNGMFTAGSGGLISPFSGTAAKGRGDGRVGLRMEFGKIQDCSELGKRLQVMRPEKRKGKWFSLQELSNRLAKLREAELADADKRLGGYGVADSLWKIQKDSVSDQKARHRAQQVTVGVLGSMGAALDEKTVGPPKDHLFEKYFHPDNMSSPEKLKLELAKVRDEFKMSDSDCGSARVQVAQLTTKIKHLSTALHKKDKHSRRGLLAMVQRRKKLLKYLRRTDWDSYCLVLSKLGLRDNPDVKA